MTTGTRVPPRLTGAQRKALEFLSDGEAAENVAAKNGVVLTRKALSALGYVRLFEFPTSQVEITAAGRAALEADKRRDRRVRV